MAQSADLKFGSAGVEEMEVWEQPCITVPANVQQYFSHPQTGTANNITGSISAPCKVFVPANDISNGIIIQKKR